MAKRRHPRREVKTLSDTIRELRADGRKRAMIGDDKVAIFPRHATFTPKEDKPS